ncbi:MAG: 5-(carboxyamino)imidazole ribonucleotide synthase [Saprospiraceae bacterium]|nr:5-(carboxyamino)imidazole ribonucleotide synthase [Saprospiraceae bacterium]
MKKIGILGGGQLGKMLCLAAADWDLEIYVLDTEGSPAQSYCKHFIAGDFNNYEDVVSFGFLVDILTIEIEHVNVKALKYLEKQGIAVHPNPNALETIKDKGLQKLFYQKHKLPTSKFQLLETITEGAVSLPCVWKSRSGGYDGKGVSVLKTADDLKKLPQEPCLIEELVAIEKEIAVIVARNEAGQVIAYPSVEMVFDPKANLLDYQLCPSNISKTVERKAQNLAKQLIKKFKLCGLLAVEMFLTKNGELLINEVAPRPHNSGHHTIEAIETSQFEQHLRAILNLPLGSTLMRKPSVLLNLVGAEGYTGEAVVDGFEKALNTEGVHVHLYGKRITKPFRKMGHVTILDRNVEKAVEKALNLKDTLRIISH